MILEMRMEGIEGRKFQLGMCSSFHRRRSLVVGRRNVLRSKRMVGNKGRSELVRPNVLQKGIGCSLVRMILVGRHSFDHPKLSWLGKHIDSNCCPRILEMGMGGIEVRRVLVRRHSLVRSKLCLWGRHSWFRPRAWEEGIAYSWARRFQRGRHKRFHSRHWLVRDSCTGCWWLAWEQGSSHRYGDLYSRCIRYHKRHISCWLGPSV